MSIRNSEQRAEKLSSAVEAAQLENTVLQTACPLSGGKINKALYVDAEGKRIYVCCEGCIDKVKDDPSKYINRLEEQGVTLENINDK